MGPGRAPTESPKETPASGCGSGTAMLASASVSPTTGSSGITLSRPGSAARDPDGPEGAPWGPKRS